MFIIKQHDGEERLLCCTNTNYPQSRAYWGKDFSPLVLLFESKKDATCYAEEVKGKGIFKDVKMDICDLTYSAKACVG